MMARPLRAQLLLTLMAQCFMVVSQRQSCGVLSPANDSAKDGVCRDIDISSNVKNLNILRNCTVIEGSLRISLIDFVPQSEYDKYRFPELREITGHLLLFKVFGLETLQNMFPNLSVIRGQKLFFDTYALIVHELRDLKEIGLIGLTNILNGAVRITKNYRLCHVYTIDWGRIAPGASEHLFEDNREQALCPDHCDESCPSTKAKDSDWRRCWTSEPGHCQKNLAVCNCKPGQICMEQQTCCHEYCLGGCWGPTAKDCFVCKNVKFRDECKPNCSVETYILANRRCLTDRECLALPAQTPRSMPLADDNRPKLLDRDNKKECVFQCPKSYKAQELPFGQKASECVPCGGLCPKVCNKTKVYTIKDSEQLRGCTKIQGDLDILVHGGKDLDKELSNNLGSIQEVTGYLKIMRSFGILTLHFFQSLEIIGGERLVNDVYSLVIVDNANLQELFLKNKMSKMRILKGNISISANRKLCLRKINDFLKSVGREDQVNRNQSRQHLDAFNGDNIPCEVYSFNVTVLVPVPNIIFVSWPPLPHGDFRQILSYLIFHKEVGSDEMVQDIYEGKDGCSANDWHMTMEGSQNKNNVSSKHEIMISPLKSFTRYAVYVQVKTLDTASYSAHSEIAYITTKPSAPSEPRLVTVEAISAHELQLSWMPPKMPNGIITDYKVFYKPAETNMDIFLKGDNCKEIPSNLEQTVKLEHSKRLELLNSKQREASQNLNMSCCSCGSRVLDFKDESEEIEKEVDFENMLHALIYVRKLSSTEGFVLPSKPNSTEMTPASATLTMVNMTTTSTPEYFENVTTKILPDDQPNIENSSSPVEVIVFNDTKITLSNLNHFQAYDIEVLACQATDNSGVKLCSTSAIASGQTLADTQADSLNSSLITVGPMSNKSGDVWITWDPPAQPNGGILQYNIKFTKVEPGKEPLATTVCINSNKTKSYKLQGLNPGNYSFQIRAVSLAGNGSYTSEIYFSIPQVADNAMDMTALIVGVSVGSFCFLVAMAAIIFCLLRKFQKRPNVVVSHNPQYIHTDDLYSPDEWEVSRENIRLIKELGQGSFGTVFEGLMENPETQISVPVAIKTVGDQADFHERLKILKEATTMKVFECHHVVKLLGVVSKGQPALIIMELMIQGDLRNYLRKCRADEEYYPEFHPPTVNQIRQMAGEIADGMAYLSQKKIVHRDLAARNCLVAEDGTVKIADFGMARDVYMTEYYRKDQKALLPVRWMAPESLMDGIFTTMSDIWSYGVVLWEMVTLAEQPYQGLSNEEVLRFVGEGRVMSAPLGCPEDLYAMMKSCWAFFPKRRPTFKFLIEQLAPSLSENFQNVSFFFREIFHDGLEAEGNVFMEADGPPQHNDDDSYLAKADESFNGDTLRITRPLDDGSGGGDNYRASRGLSSMAHNGDEPSDDEENLYLESSPARISPSPSTPPSHSPHHQEPSTSKHHQDYSSNFGGQSDSDNDCDDEEMSEDRVVDRDVGYMRSPKDTKSSSERLKLLPESSYTVRPRTLTPAPLSFSNKPDAEEYTVMSPPSTNKNTFSALSSPPASLSFSEAQLPPSWLAKPVVQVNAEGGENVNVISSRNGGPRDAILMWPNNKRIVSGNSDIMSPTSEGGGSKDSSSSAGSQHRFSHGTANGHGPYSHQQPALC
ncbi:unnamed protein product [Lymnaea stagnalis]|uniref:Tyrosine-protein kinase receptor n=1 Tax=Lymnaea stagnalis TaxID=6523 RepID=A0AAV2IPT7_LYMST